MSREHLNDHALYGIAAMKDHWLGALAMTPFIFILIVALLNRCPCP